MTTPRLLITPGEPAGIGPDVTVQIAQQDWPVQLIAIADPVLLRQRAQQLQLPLTIAEVTPDALLPNSAFETTPHQAGKLLVMPVTLNTDVVAGKLEVMNADYVYRCLELAATLCKEQKAAGIVTGPVQKSVMQDAGIAFMGHTEFFAEQSGVPMTVMMFVIDNMKVALATTHLPLAQVPQSITEEYLRPVIEILHKDLRDKFGIAAPRIAVCGLNPHAGEDGHLGWEEKEIIIPLMKKLQQEGLNVDGPLAADTAFLPGVIGDHDVILAMYHDQALPLVKYLGFDRAVNVTLGLPFVRTSVDHGTALGIAGSGKSDPGSMKAAIELALKLVQK